MLATAKCENYGSSSLDPSQRVNQSSKLHLAKNSIMVVRTPLIAIG